MVRDFSVLGGVKKGFTIPELLVVIAIISLFTAITLPNFRAGEQSLSLERSAYKLAQDVRRVEELAQRAQAFNCNTGSITGYGIVFDTSTPNTYTIFANCNSNNIYDSSDDDVDVIELEKNITITDTSPGGPQVSIIFTPPIPAIKMHPSGSNEIQIILSPTGSAISRSVTITNKGIIGIE